MENIIKNKKELEKFINKQLPNHVPYLILTIERSQKYMIMISTVDNEKIEEFKNIFNNSNVKILDFHKMDDTNTNIKVNICTSIL